jgi:hypothetical protein
MMVFSLSGAVFSEQETMPKPKRASIPKGINFNIFIKGV